MRTNYLSPWRVFDPFDSLFQEASQSEISSTPVFSSSHVEETEKEYLIEMDVPGIKKEDLTLKLENKHLTIEGERKGRVAGKFKKAYYLPDDANPDSVEAEHKHGVLSIKISKLEKAIGKTIPILSQE